MTAAPEVVVRPLEGQREVDEYCALAGATFHPERGPEGAIRRRRRIEMMPRHEPALLRGAFLDGALVGGYHVERRWLRLGSVRLETAAIAAVVTDPRRRRYGVATAMMRDAIDFARERGFALLLLDGIPDFYGRFGYVDVFNLVEHVIARGAFAHVPRGGYQVREASEADAETLLALFERHHADYPGSFERTLEDQQHRLRFQARPHLAFDADGQARGCLAAFWGEGRAKVGEVVADDWEALATLLHHDAARISGDALRWMMRPDSAAFLMLADRVELHTSIWNDPGAGWMARPASPEALVSSLRPPPARPEAGR